MTTPNWGRLKSKPPSGLFSSLSSCTEREVSLGKEMQTRRKSFSAKAAISGFPPIYRSRVGPRMSSERSARLVNGRGKHAPQHHGSPKSCGGGNFVDDVV